MGRAEATEIVDHHDPAWPEQIVAATQGRGVDAAANAARGGAATARELCVTADRLATITRTLPSPNGG